MATLKEFLKPTDQLLIDKFLEDPVKFQETRKIIEESNVRKESSSSIQKSKTQGYRKTIRVVMPVK